MGFKVDKNKAISLYKSKGGKIKFENDLKKIFGFVENDNRINDVRELAYLLATAEVESSYSLSRWESDYTCKDLSGKSLMGRSYIGNTTDNKPCQRALNYFKSTDGKSNYYSRGTDKRGLPYFGRGLIQITHPDNYKKRGQNIGLGDALFNDPDLIMKNPKISYDASVDFLITGKGSKKYSTFDLVKQGDLVGARRWVNGCSRDNCKPDAENSYDKWLSVLNNSDVKLKATKGYSPQEASKISGGGSKKKGTGLKALGFAFVFISVVGFAYGLYYFSRVKK